jgi:hypothetical protein
MTENQTPSPAEVLTEAIDQTRYELVQEIRRMGERVQESIRDYQEIAAAAQHALDEEHAPFGGVRAMDNPVQVLRDMEPLIKAARTIGVPEDAILAARRGEFVSVMDYITPPAK